MIIGITDPHWDKVNKITDINPDDYTCITHNVLGNQTKVQVPETLFNALIQFGVRKAEQKFIEQDIERSEWDPNRPD